MTTKNKILTKKQAKDIDARAQERFYISTLMLMENAGRTVAEEALKFIKNKKIKKVVIFCGKGNNGGDGFVAARHLSVSGIRPDIFLAGKINAVGNAARINLKILQKLKQKIIEVNQKDLDIARKKIFKNSLIIDALLGVGLEGEVRGVLKDLIRIINSSKAYILSVDIPSGLDATSGKVLGCCVKADKTITFVAKKRGMMRAQGPKYCGRVVVKDLGILL